MRLVNHCEAVAYARTRFVYRCGFRVSASRKSSVSATPHQQTSTDRIKFDLQKPSDPSSLAPLEQTAATIRQMFWHKKNQKAFWNRSGSPLTVIIACPSEAEQLFDPYLIFISKSCAFPFFCLAYFLPALFVKSFAFTRSRRIFRWCIAELIYLITLLFAFNCQDSNISSSTGDIIPIRS